MSQCKGLRFDSCSPRKQIAVLCLHVLFAASYHTEMLYKGSSSTTPCRQMGWDERDPYKYYPERGLYYHEVWPRLFCGSQPLTVEDVDHLAVVLGAEGTILNLQQDKDVSYWGVDLQSIQAQASHRDLTYVRRPVSFLQLNVTNFTVWLKPSDSKFCWLTSAHTAIRGT